MHPLGQRERDQRRASMGPPLKAAENGGGRCGGSIRSRGFNGAAAKSSGKYGAHSICVPRPQLASMGPPLKAAENRSSGVFSMRHGVASMGPPLKAAENPSVTANPSALPSVLQWGRR